MILGSICEFVELLDPALGTSPVNGTGLCSFINLLAIDVTIEDPSVIALIAQDPASKSFEHIKSLKVGAIVLYLEQLQA